MNKGVNRAVKEYYSLEVKDRDKLRKGDILFIDNHDVCLYMEEPCGESKTWAVLYRDVPIHALNAIINLRYLSARLIRVYNESPNMDYHNIARQVIIDLCENSSAWSSRVE